MEVPFKGMKLLKGFGANEQVAVILFHAYTGTPADVAPLARQLNQLGYTVICPLFKGHGSPSIYDLLQAGPHDWWQEAVAVIAWTQQTYAQLVVFGLSMGGLMATKAMTQLDLGLQAGGVFNSPILAKQGLNLSAHFMAYAQRLYRQNQSLELFEAHQAEILALHHQQVEQIRAFTHAFEQDLPMINRPFYIAQSAQDELIEARGIYDAMDLLTQAKIDFHWFKENTHVITVNRNRAAFEQSVIQFLQVYIAD